MSSRKLLVILLAVVFIIGAVGSAGAKSSYVTTFSSAYSGSATSSFSCSICHTSAPTRNAYGTAWGNAGHNFNTIESQDSDGDGATNIAEINAGTNPGDAGSKPAPTPVACTGYTYSAWSACDTNGQQTRTVTGSTPSGCSGTPATPAVLTQACTPPPVACTGYTYSAWSVCGANGQQTRTVTANTPAGCSGTPSTSAVLTQACTPSPVACTDYTYSSWSVCGANGQQSRTVTANTPAGCSGTPSTSAVLTQACTPSPVACTDYTYSAWSACSANGQQSRTVTAYSPSGCTGTPSTFAALTQACTPMSSGMMPMPTSQMMFLYDPTTDPVIGFAPEDTIPMGVGSVAMGGDILTIHAQIDQFQMPMDMYFALYAPLIDPFNIYLINQEGDLQPMSTGMSPWITGVTSIDEMPFGGDIPTSMLPEGTYYLGLMATPAGSNLETYYFWMTSFLIQ